MKILHFSLILFALVTYSTTLRASSSYVVPELATELEVKQAFKVFKQWTTLYQQQKYDEQHALVHPLIRKYRDKWQWKKMMGKSQRINGVLQKFDILAVSPIKPDKIPCTERGHCYRKDMQVVIILINSHYKKIGDMDKEYILMANSAEGWRFGGGTFLNTPFGETSGILDRIDEKRYEYKGVSK